jgi:hypothetical protein
MHTTSIRRRTAALTTTALATFALSGAGLCASSASAAPGHQLDAATSSGSPTAAQNQKIQERQ